MDLNNSMLHSTILNYFIDHGYAPSINVLAEELNKTHAEIIAALEALEDYHGVVLHPHTSEIWVIHPFSTAPTNFVVHKGAREWWGNCAWCSFGAAAILGEEVEITTTLGANGRQVTLHVLDGTLQESDYLVHFPIPMVDAWQNVIFTCSTMLVFEDEPSIEKWCSSHNLPKGDVQPAAKICQFAKTWYGNHLRPDWKKWTLNESRKIFDSYELHGRIWDIPASDGTF